MKVFRLAKAELNKLFQRPAIFIMVAFLVVSLVLISILYNPQLRTDTRIKYEGINTTEINTQFQSDKNSIQTELTSIVNEINAFTYNINNEDSKLDVLKNLLTTADNSLKDFHYELLKDEKNLSLIKEKLKTYKTNIRNIQTYLSTIENKIDFFITYNQLTELKNFFSKLDNDIPANTTNYSVDNMIELGNFLVTERTFSEFVYPITNTLQEINLDATKIDMVVQKYYNEIVTNQDSTLSTYEEDIDKFYVAHSGSNDEKDLETLNDMYSNYKSIVLMAKTNLQNSFTLLQVENISNSNLNYYVGFDKINKYVLQEEITKNDFLLENNQFDKDFANNFNFNATAGFNVTAYDFTIFAMQILSLIIAVFCIFFGAGLIAGEHTGKTMKMLAIRPYTRNKIFIGKFIACIAFMIILILVSFVASFVVGSILYGVNLPNILLIINATTPTVVHPIIALLIYLASTILNIIFYISISMLLSVIFRSSTISVLTAFICYIITILFNMLFIKTSWFKILPFAHLDIFKYFGNASTNGEFLNFNMIIDGNIIFSIIYLISIILLFNVLSLVIFKKRNIT